MRTIPALILAGGQSSRMGREKALVKLKRKPLIEHVIERLEPQVSDIVINTGNPDISALFPNAISIKDLGNQSNGPLSGILAGMVYFLRKDIPHFITVSVDCPFLPNNLVASLSSAINTEKAIVIARSSKGDHPTIALWPSALAPELTEFLDRSDNFSIRRFLENQDLCEVEFKSESHGAKSIDPFFNVNTEQDLEVAENFIAES